MARFYANENFPLPVVQELRLFGHDVLTSADSGKTGQSIPDEDVLSFATTQGRAVLTLNRKHFVRMHRLKSEHSGIVVCTVDLDFVGQARRIDEGVKALKSLAGELVRINRPTGT